MSRPLPACSLLDASLLPVAELARIAMREGVRPRAAYQAHKWFARRFAVTARALLVAADSDQREEFWDAYYRGGGWEGQTVLDPFAGGGVMLLEASRLGADVKGVDVEPVAAAISSFQTRLRDLPDLSAALRGIVESVGAELAPFYESRDAHGHEEVLLHAFWVQVVECAGCGLAFDAHPTYRLAWDDAKCRQWIACEGCSEVLEAELGATSVRCVCGAATVTSGGRLDAGVATCPGCGRRERLIENARRTGIPSFRMFAVETLPKGKERRTTISQRRLRAATPFNIERYESAERRLRALQLRSPRTLPSGPIPVKGRSDDRLVDYGYTDYAQLFNARQRLHLGLLGREIRRLEGLEREALAVAFSDHLTTNNMMCAYAGGWRRLTPLFSIRAYRHIARPVEINPWLERNGRGTFPNAVRSVVRASEALKWPLEPTLEGGLRSVVDVPTGRAEIVCGDARHLAHVESASVDFVLTDPPYFDCISYSELGHFFSPWLSRFGLIRLRDHSVFPRGQIASAARSVASQRRFSARLAEAFREVRRVCRPDGRVVFTYQNLDGRGWYAVGQALARAGIVPMRVLPMYGDSSAGLHKHAQSVQWDAVLVCRLRGLVRRLKIGHSARQSGAESAQRWADDLGRKGLVFTEGDKVNLAYAATLVAALSVEPLIGTPHATSDDFNRCIEWRPFSASGDLKTGLVDQSSL